jgi:predicted nucleic acid-binding protein
MNETYYLDTYAIIEIIKGNKNYLPYKDKIKVVTVFNLIELHYRLLKEFGEEISKKYLMEYKEVINFSLQDIMSANEFRLKNKNKELSFTDCIGYIISKNKNMKFLTGDKQFEKMENVEFVR